MRCISARVAHVLREYVCVVLRSATASESSRSTATAEGGLPGAALTFLVAHLYLSADIFLSAYSNDVLLVLPDKTSLHLSKDGCVGCSAISANDGTDEARAVYSGRA